MSQAQTAHEAEDMKQARELADQSLNWAQKTNDPSSIENIKKARENAYVWLDIGIFKFGSPGDEDDET